jgi:hypothetical protein
LTLRGATQAPKSTFAWLCSGAKASESTFVTLCNATQASESSFPSLCSEIQSLLQLFRTQKSDAKRATLFGAALCIIYSLSEYFHSDTKAWLSCYLIV